MSPRSRDAMRPSFAFELHTPSRKRAQGRPGARCTRGLVRKMHKQKRTRAYRFSGSIPAFPAQWFTAYNVLSPVTGLSCHRRFREALASQKLDTSVGVSGPHDFAVRFSTLVSCTAASTAPLPYVRDDRETPLVRAGMAQAGSADLPDGESGIFFTRGMDRKSARLANQLPRRASIRLR